MHNVARRLDPFAIAAAALAVTSYLLYRFYPLLGFSRSGSLTDDLLRATGALVALACGIYARRPERMKQRSGRDVALAGMVLAAYLLVAPLYAFLLGLLFRLIGR